MEAEEMNAGPMFVTGTDARRTSRAVNTVNATHLTPKTASFFLLIHFI